MKRAWKVARLAWRKTLEDRILTYAAALAFYSALSLPPILVILLWVFGLSGSGEEHLRQQASLLLGEHGSVLIDSVLDSAEEQHIRLQSLAGLLSSGALLFAATGAFAQLQRALNRIWDVEAKSGTGIWSWVRRRLLSLGLLGSLAFLMLVSLTASTVLSAFGIDRGDSFVARSLAFAATIALFTVLFAAVFKFLPDVRIRWRDVWLGAFVTAILFSIGKSLIGLYVAGKGLGSSYGVLGPAIVVLVWAYFSGAIVFVGAEITQAWLQVGGRRLEPNDHAVPIDRET